MKFFNDQPNGNEISDLEPARYFNLAIEQIQEITEWLKNTEQPTQALLLHLEVYLVLSKRYKELAQESIFDFDLDEVEEVFNSWFDRCKDKIPSKYRDGIKKSSENLFEELHKLEG